MSVETFWEPSTTYGDTPTFRTALNDFHTQFGNLLTSVVSNDAAIVMSHGRFYSGSTVVEAFTSLAEIAGGGDGPTDGVANEINDLPEQDAAVIQRRTGLAGRQHSGRIFIPCIAESLQASGRIDAGDVAAFKNIAIFLGADVTVVGNVWHARHWNRKDNVLEVVTECRAMIELKSRRDRQRRTINLPVP
jgi:hypothetical protein